MLNIDCLLFNIHIGGTRFFAFQQSVCLVPHCLMATDTSGYLFVQPDKCDPKHLFEISEAVRNLSLFQ